jgi:hypothetical protein
MDSATGAIISKAINEWYKSTSSRREDNTTRAKLNNTTQATVLPVCHPQLAI